MNLFKLNLQLFGEDNPDNEEKTGEDKLSIVDAYNKLKAESVSKEEYEKLQKEHTEVIRKIMNGESVELETASPDTKALAEKLFGGQPLTNLEYTKTVLELRDALIAEGKPDPFLPIGAKISPTEEDIAAAQRVAAGLAAMVEEADGSPEAFRIAYQSRVIDVKR